MDHATTTDPSITVRMHVREFTMPPIQDALVLGKKTPIGCEAMRKALALLHVSPFEHIEINDDVVGNILVRSSVLKKIPRDKLVRLLLHHVKPLMTDQECIHLELQPELILEEQV